MRLRTQSLAVAMMAVACFTSGCNETTSPTDIAIEPFIRGLPEPFSGSATPNYAGRWSGEYRRVACRAITSVSCTRDAPPRNDQIHADFVQLGSTVSGSVNFPGPAGFTGTFTFSGYISASGGVAGTATKPNPPNSSSNPFETLAAVLEPLQDSGLSGSFYQDNYRETTGVLFSTRKYDVVVPLRRVQ